MRWLEFVTDRNGKLSGKRLAGFAALGVASYVMIITAHKGTLSDDLATYYCLFMAAAFGVSVLEKCKHENRDE